MIFTNVEKEILDYFFTSSNENDTVYAAKQTLPQEIVGYIIGRASRAKETFREIFLKLWLESFENCSLPVSFQNYDTKTKILDKISDKAFKFLNEYKLHNSLRDVPHVAIFCDELSILQTKVWEHEVVAEYQEKSTRYRPFVASNVYMPNDISSGLEKRIKEGHELLINSYNSIFEATGKRDLARYLLPVGSKTAMACMASIRSWERIVARMLAYPTNESYKLADDIIKSIRKAFGKIDSFIVEDSLVLKYVNEFAFLKEDCLDLSCMGNDPMEQESIVRKIDSANVYKIDGLIDIGAHRDLQRHRSVIQNFPDYRPIYGYDKLISEYIDNDLYIEYSNCMKHFNEIFKDVYKELCDKNNCGEIQYVSLLGHMTKFWYITDSERWKYVHDLRTGDPCQQSTNSKTVHFSYSTWCKKTEDKIRLKNLEKIHPLT